MGDNQISQQGHNSQAHSVARDQIRSFVERVERLQEQKKAVSDDIKDVFAEAKCNGFDVKTLRKVVSLRKIDANERAEQEAMLDLYLDALGMQPSFDFEQQDSTELQEPEPQPDSDGDILDPETGELKPADDDTTQAVIDAVEDDLTDEEKEAKAQERLKNAHAFGRGSYDEHQDADQNPYFEEEDDDLRNAWFNGFYERKNEVEPGDDEKSDGEAETLDADGSDGDDQTAPVETETEEASTDNGDPATDQAETPPETADGVSDDYTAGLEHRKDDGSRDENPHDGGTQEHSDWQEGFDAADKGIAELFNAGYEAAEAGKAETDSGWKKGTFEHTRWMFGFDRWHKQNNSDE